MRHSIITWWLPLLLLSITAFILQNDIYINKDVAFLLHTTMAMLEGKTYAKDIFEPNPPLILYLQMPIVMLSKMTGINILTILCLYTLALICISISCSYYFIQKLFNHKTLLYYLLLYLLAGILLFLPVDQFSQREHFLMILVIPYFFSAALYLENKKTNKYLLFLVGILAGVGFAIKPYFLPALVLTELYIAYKKRNIFGWIRTESLVIIAILIIYPNAVYLFYPEYFHTVLPLWIPYYTSIAHTWSEMLAAHDLIFCYLVMLFYLMTRQMDRYKITTTIFFFALIGFAIAFLIPRVTWYYHALPAISAAFILFALIFGQLLPRLTNTKYNIMLSIIAGIIIVISPLSSTIINFHKSINTYKTNQNLLQLISFIKNKNPNNSFNYFSMNHNLSILEYYTNARFTGNLPYFGWEYNRSNLKYRPSKQADIYQDKIVPYMVNTLAKNIDETKPQLIIIDILSANEILGIDIDYIKEYSQYKNFQSAWDAYQYITSIGRYQIYERKDNKKKPLVAE